MKKKILAITFVIVIAALLIAPVFADPTKGQKVGVTITWNIVGPTYLGPWKYTGNAEHREVNLAWDVTVEIDGGPTLTGTATTERKLLRINQGDGQLRILNDYYVITLTGGTFEGNALIQTQWLPGGPANVQSRLCHALLQGTGDFEGQTINAEHDWRTHDLPIVWPGYILKYPLPP
jgi:hypothetical protein